MDRHIILQSIYFELSKKKLVKNKGDFARQIGYNPSVVSSAFNGDMKFCTEGLMKAVVHAFPQVNKEFVWKGEGDILLDLTAEKEEAPAASAPAPAIPLDIIKTLEEQIETNKNLLERLVKAQDQIDKSQRQIDILISIIQDNLGK